MSKKPEILVTPNHIDAVEPLIRAGATAILVGEARFGLRLAGEFSLKEVEKATEIAHRLDARVYVAMNALFHNEMIPALAEYIKAVSDIGVDAVTFGDPAVLMTAREVAPQLSLQWSTEITATNWYTANYWGRKGAKRAILSKEISMDAIVETKENAELEIEVQVHGMTNMFQSKRTLVGNYFQFQGRNLEIEQTGKERQMFLFDPERDAKYPIFEDVNGTHIMSPNDICIIDELEDMLEAGIDSFKIEGLLKSTAYMEKVTSLYRRAIDLYFEDEEEYQRRKQQFFEEIKEIQPENRKLDTGFFFKETVY